MQRDFEKGFQIGIFQQMLSFGCLNDGWEDEVSKTTKTEAGGGAWLMQSAGRWQNWAGG